MKQDGITLPTLNATVEAVPIIQVTPESTDGKLSSLPNQAVTIEKVSLMDNSLRLFN